MSWEDFYHWSIAQSDRATSCPYYRWSILGESTDGICVSGCHEEPFCLTNEPAEGWTRRDSRGRFLPRKK